MIFTETRLDGAYVIEVEPIADERGLFARVWCERELAEHGLDVRVSQSSIAFNNVAGTLRGMHWQEPPHAEVKLVRCIRGALYDVGVDLRPASPTFRGWVGVELTADNRRAFYLPDGFAHGYQTLAPGTEVLYQMSAPYAPEAARGFRWNDPSFGIDWPLESPAVISARDAGWPDYQLPSRM